MIEKLFDGNMFLAITTNDPETMEQKLDKIKDYKCLKSPCHGLIYHIPENGMGGYDFKWSDKPGWWSWSGSGSNDSSSTG